MKAILKSLRNIELKASFKVDNITYLNKECSFEKNNGFYNIHIPKDFDFSKPNIIKVDEREIIVDLNQVPKSKDFEIKYRYRGQLGSVYTKKHTTFYLFSPTAFQIELVLDQKKYQMKRYKDGAWVLKVDGDYLHSKYFYNVNINNQVIKVLDPYGYANFDNYSTVMDVVKLQKEVYNFKRFENPVIYEVSVKDTTYSLPVLNKGKFLGLTEDFKNEQVPQITNILKYIKDMGITHLQLLPVFDFYGIDEQKYNWGYNPVNYFTLQKEYATKRSSINAVYEFKKLIDFAHSIDLNVTMDVVYNHVYELEMFAYHKLVPNYFFRFNNDGTLDNATYCGNTIKSENFMVRRMIVDSLVYLTKTYKIDGYRFDLMGLTDITTMNQIYNKLTKINPNILLYGEGWNMPTNYPSSKLCHQDNAKKIPFVSFFNDQFRNHIKGNGNRLGFGFGQQVNFNLCNLSLNGTFNKYVSPIQSLNYIECHDNHTAYDWVKHCNPNMQEQDIRDYLDFALDLTIISKGIVFIHAYQENYRTKKGVENSYNSPIEINKIDWDFTFKNNLRIKELLKVRKNVLQLDNYTYWNLYDLNYQNENLIRLYYNGCFIFIKNDFKEEVLSVSKEKTNQIYATRYVHEFNRVFKPGIYIYKKK